MADEEKNKGIMGDFEDALGGAFLETILPKILPQIEPVANQIKKVLGNDEKRIMLQMLNGQMVLFVIESDGIIAMDIAEDKFKAYPLDKYKDMLLNGGVEQILEEVNAK